MHASKTEKILELVHEPHKSMLRALAENAGIPGVLSCYPTRIGFEVYCKTPAVLGRRLFLCVVEEACRAIPGFLGARGDDRGYVHAVVLCDGTPRAFL